MAGKGGGAWKVAYADFVTAMMAFFMVMWLTAQSPKVKEAVAEHFREPDPTFAEMLGIHENGRDPQRKPQRHPDHENLPDARKPKILAVRDGTKPVTAVLVPFAEASAELTTEAEQYLQDLVTQYRGKPQKIEIRGHASRRPLPAESEYKTVWELSYARSLAVMKYLETQGIEASRIRLSQSAANEPLTAQADPNAITRNERVEVYVLSEY